MPTLTGRKFQLRRWTGSFLPLIYIALGLAFIPQIGIQDDEALFAAPFVHGASSAIFSLPLFHRQLPLMLLTYLGTLKTWLYFPIAGTPQASPLAIRLPVLMTGSLTAWIFIWLLERTSGKTVALVGGLLLATDTMFLMTTCFDWGPVALQHLLSVAGLALVVKFAADQKRWALAVGFFCFGLALWDKALFVWLFSGMMLATIAVFPRELWVRCTLRNVATAGAALLLGALPLGIYNASANLATFRANSAFDLHQIPSRLHALGITWDGQILWGYMVHAPWSAGPSRGSGSAIERVSAAIHALAGFRYHNQLEPAFWIALALTPILLFAPGFARARKPLLFCLIAMVVAWVQMAITRGAGDGAHHVVLLWPLPHWFLAVALVEASRWKPLRWRRVGAVALGAVMALLVGENLLLTNEYFYQLSHFGALGSWSDAIYQLADDVSGMPGLQFVADDWGIVNSLAVLRGRGLSVEMGNPHSHFSDGVWIGHTPEFEQHPQETERIVAVARASGLEKRGIRIVSDREGRPVFEIFRFVRSAD